MDDGFILALRFLIGLALGSFLNVLTMRYDPARPLFSFKNFSGKSHCPACGRSLRWFELVPFLSFVFLGGRCRTCRARLSLQYPAVELLSAFSLAAIPFALPGLEGWLWAVAALVGLIIIVIDLRHMIIPDEANLALAALGALRVLVRPSPPLSEFGYYRYMFGFPESFVFNRAIAAGIGLAFFALIVIFSRGRGMGMGDVKLAGASGILLGWPDIILAVAVSFLAGALVSILLMSLKRKGLKSAIPFGPFIVLGIFVARFAGGVIVSAYFTFFEGLYA